MEHRPNGVTRHPDGTTLLGQTTAIGNAEAAVEGALPPRLDRYVLLEVLGAGGMGVVYSAYDTELARRVAVKVLPRGPGRRWAINAAPRLRREARALARLAHPHVVAIYDVGEAAGTLYVAMALVEGRTLSDWNRSEPRAWAEVVDAYVQAGEGLAAAHRVGLVHRDFKPDNTIIDDAGRVQVLDFGLAVGEAEQLPDAIETVPEGSVSVSARLTVTGAVMGTPAYMAPEQIAGAAADARSDQFSFCVALYEALHGVRPFAGRDLSALAEAIHRGELQPGAPDREVPGWLRRLVLRGLRARPSERWRDMPSLLAALRRGRRRSMRRRVAALVGGGLLLGVGLIGIPRAVAASKPCEAAAAEIHRTWGPQQHAEVRGALLGTELSYAEDTWARVERGLDDYAKGWAEQRRAVCETVTGEPAAARVAHDLRVACLERRRAELSTLVAVLGEADVGVATRASKAVAELPAIERCGDVQTLQEVAGSSADPDRTREVRTRLAEAHALELAGRYVDGRRIAQAAQAQAEAMGDTALTAEALLRLGLLHERSADYPEAERVLQRAAWLAMEAHHDEITADAMVQLAGVVGYLQARRDDGLAWGRHAQAAVARAGAGVDERVRLWNNLGAIHDRAGDLERAREHYAEALRLLEDPRDDVARQQRASTLNNLGNTAARLGDLPRAQRDLEAAVEQIEALRGPSHPDVAIMLANLANVEMSRGRLSDAERHHRRALAIREQALGPDHPQVASSLLNLGVALQQGGKAAQARPHFERAVVLKEAAVGSEHHETAIALNNLGEVLRELDQPRRAAVLHRRALSIWSSKLGDDHPLSAYPATNLGLDLIEAGEPGAAIELLTRALAIRERSGGEPALRGITRLGLARAIEAQGGDPARARALGRAAWQDLVDAPPQFQRERSQARAWLDARREVTIAAWAGTSDRSAAAP